MQPEPSAEQPHDDVDRAKDFLSWAREHGFAFESIQIGSVQLVGTRDLIPHVKAQVNAIASAEAAARADDWPASVYDQFRNPTERTGQ